MNRNTTDKKALARRKILIAHYYDQDIIQDNKRYRDYKTLKETILESSEDMEKTQMLPCFMSWIGRDNDGLPLMYELLQRYPLLCENKAPNINIKKRSRSDWMTKTDVGGESDWGCLCKKGVKTLAGEYFKVISQAASGGPRQIKP